MNRSEYTAQLNDIAKKLNEGENVSEIMQSLEALYDFKPVSMQWHQLMCKAMIQNGQVTEAINQYRDFVNKEYSIKENLEIWALLAEAYRLNGQTSEGNRQEYMLSRLEKTQFFQDIDTRLSDAKNLLIEGNESKEHLDHLEELYFISNNKIMAYFVYLYSTKLYADSIDAEKELLYLNLENVRYLAEYIQDKKAIILVAEEHNHEDYDILSYILHALSVPVYMVGSMFEIEGDFSLIDSVQVSLDNAQQYEDCRVIPSIMKIEKGQRKGDNIAYIIDYLCKHSTEDDFALTITSNNLLEQLRTHKDICKRFERLSRYEAAYLEDEIGFGRAGDYYTYINRLYQGDAKNWVDANEEYDFSIVIPIRNATETLYYTLQTCLNQEYDGSYEVVISDNSTDGHNVVYDTFKRLNDKRLKYYKTPRDLSLTKSYEFAYLQTRGKFIIPIGGDDGILPWALQTLKEILSNEQSAPFDIVCWSRGFYAWPGFNGGQQNQFVIPGYYKKNQVNGSVDSSEEYLRLVKVNAQGMYALPNMYINSGFFRRHLKTLYEKTGCILDGASQDISMGLTNHAIHTPCLRIDYPITIAGMSPSSIGNINNKVSEGGNTKIQKMSNMLLGERSLCSYIPARDIMTPNIGTDVSGMYRYIVRLMAKVLLPMDFITEEELKKIYLNCYNSTRVVGDKYYKYILEGYEIAKTISTDFAKWFEKELLTRKDSMVYVNKEQMDKLHTQKLYTEGYSANGGVTLDASRFGVTNIFEAVQLFEDFLHF